MTSTQPAPTSGPDPVVVFCNVCNQSIPESALNDGRAVRLPSGGCPTASVDASGQRPGATWKLLAPSVLILGGLVAGVLYLEQKIGQVERSGREQVASLAGANAASAKTFSRVDESLGTLATDEDVASLGRSLQQLADRLDQLEKGIDDRFDDAERDLGRLDQRQKSDATKVVQLSATAALIRDDIQQVASVVNELRAAPRAAGPVAPVGSVPDEIPEDPVVTSGLPPELAHLASQLEDEDGATRYEAVDQLLASGDDRVYALVLPLARDPDLFVRRVVLEGLAQRRAVESVDALIVALADPESLVRDTAIRGLREVTGQSFLFDPDARPEQRASMQRRWQKWWDEARATF